jgi:YesN/AraC family two-component response regulator
MNGYVQRRFMFKTLIVDDNAEFRQSLNDILATRFPAMHVVEAGDGMQARGQIVALEPDLIFMDISLPDGNGLDLAREFKTVHVDTVIIVITGYDLPEYRLAARECGASHFLSKASVDQAEILSLVESIVSGSGSVR